MNFCKLTETFFKVGCVYVDTKDHLADKIFIDHKLKVKFKGDFENKTNDYELITIEFPKKKLSTFIKCMQELENKLLILGHNDYSEVAEEVMSILRR